jgi:hypothetical protein
MTMTQRDAADKYDNVKRIMERWDLDALEKLVLIDILMRVPPPTIEADERGNTIETPGMAIGPSKQIAERIGKGASKSTVKDRIKGLRKKGFLKYIRGVGQTGNRYRVVFPKPKKKIDSLTRRVSRIKTVFTKKKKKKK